MAEQSVLYHEGEPDHARQLILDNLRAAYEDARDAWISALGLPAINQNNPEENDMTTTQCCTTNEACSSDTCTSVGPASIHLPAGPNPVVATDTCRHCGGEIIRRSWGDWLHAPTGCTGCQSNTAAQPVVAHDHCPAALNVAGEHYPCDQPTDVHGLHAGWAHNSRRAQAIWTDDPEAIAQGWDAAERAGR